MSVCACEGEDASVCTCVCACVCVCVCVCICKCKCVCVCENLIIAVGFIKAVWPIFSKVSRMLMGFLLEPFITWN